ncbi:MAG: aminopeptidase P family protein [bacterium]|nr:aminopeptidase P family protein [bacterium]
MAKRPKTGPRPFIQARIEGCRAVMAERGVDAFLITGRMDHYYLTGFSGEDSAVLITRRGVHVITDRRFETSSAAEVGWARRHFRKVLLPEEVGNVCRKLKLAKLHIQPGAVTVADHAEFRKSAKPTRLANAPDILGQLRRFKDRDELSVIKRAIKVAEDAFKATRRSIRVGQTEREMAARLEYEMAKRGSSGCAFPSIVAEGPNAALPHAVPGSRKVRKGSAILFDWGATVDFYCSDLTRMVFVGSIPPKIRRIYGIVLEAQEKAIEAVKPGERMCDVDAVARRYIKKHGFGKFFGHGLGHGMGLDVHEPPRLSWMSEEKLAPGMVVTVEPGIYLPGVGGVRIEDDVVVTERACKVLSSVSKDLQESVV